MSQKALLLILDGWGIGDGSKSDAIASTPTPYWDSLLQNYPHAQLRTDGLNVGLPKGQMGNSEVGHMNIGGGRIVYQDLVKINMACEDGSIAQNKEIVGAYENAQKGGDIHFMGLTSTGGVHSSLAHLLKLVDLAKSYGLEGRTFIHCFMDGRDTDPRSGKGFIQTVADHCQEVGCGEIASITGRFYAMDRDKRWDRIKKAYDQLTAGVGSHFTCPVQAMEDSYAAGVTDEFVEPTVLVDANDQVKGLIKPGDTVIFFNYRNDRAKEITAVLTQEDMPEQGMKTLPLYYCTMTPYDAKFQGLHILFPKENVENTLGEIVSNAGMKQLRIAETEKYAHVTFFFNGGREAEYPGEERCLVPSPKVATYDLQPEMSAPIVCEKLCAAIAEQKYDFIACNFANGDMVGHTGIYPAIEKAVITIDQCCHDVCEAAKANGYDVVIIADHGNCDYAINPDGTPNTAHSLNPVPCVYISQNQGAKVEDGRLCDVAPSILSIMGIAQPADMTGVNLITK